MTQGFNVDDRLHPNHLVAAAVQAVYPDSDAVLRPQDVDGLTDSFTVFYFGEVVDGVQYFVGLYGEHNVEDMPINPMNMNPLVIGIQLTDGRLTVADALPAEEETRTLGVANVLMLVQYGEDLTTDQQPPADPNHEDWTVKLEEYPEPVTCHCLATIDHDNNTYSFYFGEGVNEGVIEHFLLVVEIIGGESFPLDIEDDELWTALGSALLAEFGIEIDDDLEADGYSDVDEDPEAADEEDVPDVDTDVC